MTEMKPSMSVIGGEDVVSILSPIAGDHVMDGSGTPLAVQEKVILSPSSPVISTSCAGLLMATASVQTGRDTQEWIQEYKQEVQSYPYSHNSIITLHTPTLLLTCHPSPSLPSLSSHCTHQHPPSPVTLTVNVKVSLPASLVAVTL